MKRKKAEYIDISDAIVAVIMYYAKGAGRGSYCFGSKSFAKLSEWIVPEKILCYSAEYPEGLFDECLVNDKGNAIWEKDNNNYKIGE